MFRSATFKLTMWYLAIVMAISLAFSGVLYQQASGELSRGLHRESQRISSQFPVFQGNPILRMNGDLATSDQDLLFRLAGFNVIVLVAAGFASYWLARRTLAPIEEAHEQQKRFTADVSHELRTPLTALRMESEVALLNEQTTKAELRQTLESNLEEVDKLEGLINNLLRLTRLEVDELRQQFIDVSSQAIMDQALARVEKTAALRSIKLKCDGHEDHFLNGDADSLVQLLVILLDNAVKYSPNGATVSLGAMTQDGWLTFSVADHGTGIAPEDLEHIFDRFYRADSSRTKAGSEGFGLGLSIAKLIADIHGGIISISSRPGQGTTAVFKLPLKPDKPAS
jgi:two-component system, OmpR family, sensor histidine kinase CiaH